VAVFVRVFEHDDFAQSLIVFFSSKEMAMGSVTSGSAATRSILKPGSTSNESRASSGIKGAMRGNSAA
jgi:hypothetical protein